MKRVLFIIITAITVAFVNGCSKHDSKKGLLPFASLFNEDVSDESLLLSGEPQLIEKVTEPTVLLEPIAPSRSILQGSEPAAALTPATLSATLKAGESINEHKVAFIPGAPPKGDLIFCLDLTGSMGGELANVKVHSVNIMNRIKSIIPDMRFAVISHMDYTGTYSGGGYGPAQYGSAASGDYPYRLDRALTDDVSNVASAINALRLGSGIDYPENYTRVLYESYADPSVAWRDGAKRFFVSWNDSVPHDLDYRLDGSGISTGPDPGRDGIQNTADDLDLENVLNEMNSRNITLIALHSGSYISLWEKYSSYTGGSAFKLNPDGTIPGGQDIGEFIAQKILESIKKIQSLKIEVVTPCFETWLTYASPEEITNINLDETKNFDFDIEITVPEGTPDGVYIFDVGIVGDGAVYATQKVTITVKNSIEVPVDIKPGSIPNPINVNSNGVVVVAICGTSQFSVSNIDASSIKLAGVSPIKVLGYEDVATPYYPLIGKPLDKMAGTDAGADGYLDLVLKFKKQDLVNAIGEVVNGEVLALKLIGKSINGTDIIGEDVIWIINHQCRHGHHRHHNKWIRWCSGHHGRQHCHHNGHHCP